MRQPGGRPGAVARPRRAARGAAGGSPRQSDVASETVLKSPGRTVPSPVPDDLRGVTAMSDVAYVGLTAVVFALLGLAATGVGRR